MKRKRIVIIAGIVALGAAFVAFRSGEKDFHELFEYEAENRAFALLWTQEGIVRLTWQAAALAASGRP